ncbi:MAG: hypothetical protein IPN15_20360 [Saprospiraceae bacterium]|nr:hypothetical protein [Candidatus Vicinibacter affinis]
MPRVQKNQATYMNGKYNNFMQQESYVDSNGFVKKPAASLTGKIQCINYDPITKIYTITFDLFNRKDILLLRQIPIWRFLLMVTYGCRNLDRPLLYAEIHLSGRQFAGSGN